MDKIRLLQIDDYNKGFMDLINYFTRYPQHKTKEEFKKQFLAMNSDIFVLEEEKTNTIIVSGTLHVEKKFHNNFKSIAHLQDIIVKEEYRNQGYGKHMILFLIKQAKTKNCYKIVLNSNLNNKIFYEKIGFILKGQEYNLYLN